MVAKFLKGISDARKEHKCNGWNYTRKQETSCDFNPYTHNIHKRRGESCAEKEKRRSRSEKNFQCTFDTSPTYTNTCFHL